MAKDAAKGSKCRSRGARKDMKGMNQRRRLGLPAKAGKRKPPKSNGANFTSEHDRKRGMFLSRLGVPFYVRPNGWRDFSVRGETS